MAPYARWLIVLAVSVGTPNAYALPALDFSNECPLTQEYVDQRIDFDLHIQPLFDSYCVSCHQPEGERFAETGLDLRAGHAYRSLARTPSALLPDVLRLSRYTDDVTQSFIWEKVRCRRPRAGHPMPPPPYAPLSYLDQWKIQEWVLRGAPPGRSGDGRRVAIQYGMNGTWSDPSLSDQGLMIEIVPGSPNLLVAGWMTTVPDDDSLVGTSHSKSKWLLGLGTYQSDASEVMLNITQRLQAGFDGYAPYYLPEAPNAGTAQLMFHSCTEATLFYDLEIGPDESRQRLRRGIALRRLSPNVLCEASPEAGGSPHASDD